MRDIETIDSELRLIAAVRRSNREHGGEPSSRQVDELLDERLGHRRADYGKEPRRDLGPLGKVRWRPRQPFTIEIDATPNNVPTEPSLSSAPSLGELVTDAVTDIVENQFTGVWLIAGAVMGALQALRRRLHGTDEPASIPPAVSSMSGPVSSSRRRLGWTPRMGTGHNRAGKRAG